MSDQTKLDALTVMHRLQTIAALEQIALGPMVSDRDELTLRNAVRLMRNDLDAVEAINALEFLAREGYGPTFTQRAVMVGARAAMGTGDDSTSFRAACRALAYTTSPEYAAANQGATKGRACPVCGHGGAVPHVPGCMMADGDGTRAHPGWRPDPVPCAPRADNVPAVVEFNSRAKKWKWVKIQGDERVSWEISLGAGNWERVEFPSRWLFDSEMRKEIFLELRRIRAKRVF